MTHDLSQDVATLLVRHCVKQGAEQDYEQWLRRTVATAKRYPGHLGVDVMRNRDAGQHQFTSVIRFASTAQLQGWLDSDDLLAAELYGLEGLAVSADGKTMWIADGTRGEDVPYHRVRVVRLP